MPTDPKGRHEAGYLRHAFICGHERPEGAARPSCAPRGSMELMRKLKQAVRESGRKDLRVQKSGCLDFCEFGPTCVVYPDGAWYALTDDVTLDAVLNHLLTGEITDDATLRMT